LSSQKDITLNGATLVTSIDAALDIAVKNDYKELMVIGGGQVYHKMLPMANKIFLTRVHTQIEGDAFFPNLDASWSKTTIASHLADDKHKYAFDFECWERK
jgi:dihydrofolate reductase